MIERELDVTDGIIFVVATGFWTKAEVDEHYDKLRALIAERRAGGYTVRVLSDVRNAPYQPPEMEAYVVEQIKRTYLPGDRVAILTPHTAAQAHVRARLGDLDVMTFTSALPAEMWLMLE